MLIFFFPFLFLLSIASSSIRADRKHLKMLINRNVSRMWRHLFWKLILLISCVLGEKWCHTSLVATCHLLKVFEVKEKKQTFHLDYVSEWRENNYFCSFEVSDSNYSTCKFCFLVAQLKIHQKCVAALQCYLKKHSDLLRLQHLCLSGKKHCITWHIF